MQVLSSISTDRCAVAAEGIAARLPVLAPREVGLATGIKEADASPVVVAQPDQAAAVWQRLLVDRELRTAMGKHGRFGVRSDSLLTL